MTACRARPPSGPAAPEARPRLRRQLGLWQVSLSGIAVILGAGVYSLIGAGAALAGSALWLAFVLAGATAALTAYSYARLGAMRPRDSPEFQYTALAFGPRVGFVAGWLMLAADLLGVATVALGFGGYLRHLAGTPATANAVALLAVLGALVLVGIGETVGLALGLTLVEVAGLGFVIVVGAPAWHRTTFLEMPHGFAGLSAAAAIIFFAYLGFDELGNFAEEMRWPDRDLPRALFLSLAGATLIYLLVALSAIAAVGWPALSASTAPLALVARVTVGPPAEAALGIVALAATGNTVLLLLLSGSRSVYGMAAAGVLPGRLAAIGRRGTPVAATVLVTAIAATAALLGDLARAAALTDAAVLLSFALVNLSLPWLAARRRTSGGRGRRLADTALPLAALALCAWLLAHTGWGGLAAAGVLAAVGLLLGPRGDRPPTR